MASSDTGAGCTCGGVGECRSCREAIKEQREKEPPNSQRTEKDSDGGYQPWSNLGPNFGRPDTFGS